MTIYYVKTTGNNSNDGKSVANAWAQISYAIHQNLAPGDIVKILPGNYNDNNIAMTSADKQGTSGNPITFTAYDINDRPVIKSTASDHAAFDVRDLSYITISYLDFNACTSDGTVHCRAMARNISNCIIDNCRVYSSRPTSTGLLHTLLIQTNNPAYTATHCRITNNYLYNCSPVSSSKNGVIFESGNECITLLGNVYNSLVMRNVLDQCIAIGINQIGRDARGHPKYNAYIENISSVKIDPAWTIRTIDNSIYCDAAEGPSLYQGNYAQNINGTGSTFAFNEEEQATIDAGLIIARNNVAVAPHNCWNLGEGGQAPDTDLNCAHKMKDLMFIHNVGICDTSDPRHTQILGDMVDFVEKNNVLVHYGNNSLTSVTPHASGVSTLCPSDVDRTVTGNWLIDYNLWYSDASPTWEYPDTDVHSGLAAFQAASGQAANGIYGAPIFVNNTGDKDGNYALTSASPGYEAAGALTFATNSGTDSTTLLVDDARYFFDGFNIEGLEADCISVGGTIVQIQSVNYDSNSIVLSEPISWSTNDDIFYANATSIGLYDDSTCTSTPVLIDAQINASITEGEPPLLVTFTDGSSAVNGITSWLWDFGDGVGTSTLQNPGDYTYTVEGTYTVTLSVTGPDGTDADAIIITVGSNVTSGCSNTILTNGDFSDGTTGWLFAASGGSGTFSVNSEIAEIDLTDYGTFTQLYQSNLSVTQGQQLVLKFDIWRDSGSATMKAHLIQDNSPFTNLGLNQEFNVTSVSTTVEIPFVVSTTEADARFRFVFDSDDEGAITYIDNICLGEYTTLTASFTKSTSSGDAPLEVSFTDTTNASGNITGWLWNFGDGNTSTLQNPTHTYVNEGNFTVTLTVTDEFSNTSQTTSSVLVTEVYIELPPVATTHDIDTLGTVTAIGSHPSWIDLFTDIGENRLGQILVSYNIFSGFGQAIEPYTDTVIQFNIDTGAYVEINDNTIISSGEDSRLSVYGLKHPVHALSGYFVRGSEYWNWWQEYNNSNIPWPDLLNDQFNIAQSL